VAQHLLQRRFPGALRPASPHHRHDQGLAPLARCRQLGPPLRAIRRLPPPHWRHLDPQDTCGRRARPLLRALPIARWRSPTLGAAPTPPLRLGLVSGLLEPPLRGQWDPGAAPRCSPRDRGIALQEGGQCLGLDGTWRSLLWPMGVLLLHCRVLRVTHCLLSRSRASRPNTFTGIIGHDPARRSSPPARPTARRRIAPRDCRWCWTGAAAWGRVEPLGGSRGKATGQAVVEGWGAILFGRNPIVCQKV